MIYDLVCTNHKQVQLSIDSTVVTGSTRHTCLYRGHAFRGSVKGAPCLKTGLQIE